MNLSGQQRKQLQNALISAFPEKSLLEQLLDYELDKKLNQITQDSNLKTVIYQLIQRAEAEGWLLDLVRATRKENPRNSQLEAIATELLTQKIPSSKSPVNLPNIASKPTQEPQKITGTIIVCVLMSGIVGAFYIVLNQGNHPPGSANPSSNRKYFYDASSTATDKWCFDIYQNLRERHTGEVPEDVAFVGVDKKKAKCFYETN